MAIFKTDNEATTLKKMTKAKDGIPFWDTFFNDFERGWTPMDVRRDFTPAINIKEQGDAYIVETELPGVNKNDIKIDIKNDHLIISGEKKSFNEEHKGDYHHIERSHGSFYRTIGLPKDIDSEKISAALNNGILTVEMAKDNRPDMNYRSIEIK